MTSHAFDLSLPDARLAAALILSRHMRTRVAEEIDPDVNWDDVRASGALPPDLFLECIELFRQGAWGEFDAVYERGRVLLASPGAIAQVRRILGKIPGRGDIAEIRLDGDWAVCRLQAGLAEGRTGERAVRRFLRANEDRFPSEVRLDGASYRCSYALGGAGDVIGIDLLATAVEDVRTWFDSFGQVLLPFYHPRESDLQEVLVISPLGMVNENDPWCWSSLADRLLPFLLADTSPMRVACPPLVGAVDALVRRFRGQPWPLPIGVRGFRRLQRKLHWSHEGEFDEVLPLVGIVAACEGLMSEFAEEFEPVIAAHADVMLDAMDRYCAAARTRLWERLHESDPGER